MHKAIKILLADFSPDEMGAWRKLEQQSKRHHRESSKALDEINIIRTTDPMTYINRLYAVFERSTDETKRLASEMKKLVDSHYKRKHQQQG